jgi:hypothetical protein
MEKKEYLGDSVYAELNENGDIVLTTENGLPDDPSNEIVMEPFVLENLKRFAESHNLI